MLPAEKERQLELFREYRESPSDELRAKIMAEYLPVIRKIAMNVVKSRSRGNRSLDFDDLVAEGAIAFLKALDRFDIGKDFVPMTFFYRRVLGGMLDAMRSADHLSRTQRKEGGDRLNLLSLSSPLHRKGDRFREMTLENVLEADGSEPTAGLAVEEFWRVACRGMVRRNRLAVLMYFRMGMTMSEVARHLGVTEARVSQLISQTIGNLKDRVGLREELAAAG